MFCGIDTHKYTHAACIVDSTGRSRSAQSYPNSPEGFSQLAAWLCKHQVTRTGIEGSGSYGFALAQELVRLGIAVEDVPANRTSQARKSLARQGKDDAGDALAIARVVASGDPLVQIKTNALARDIRLLNEYRQRLVKDRTATINAIHAAMVILAPGTKIQIRISRVGIQRCLDQIARDTAIHADVTRDQIQHLITLNERISSTGKRLKSLVEQTETTLMTLAGVGENVAATIIGEVGDIRRYKTAAQFAAANGTAPIPASSGNTQRMRLNRGGNRRVNNALYTMALVQYRFDPRAQAFIDKHRAQGKTFKEALRCLKRHLSNVIYKTMLRDALTT